MSIVRVLDKDELTEVRCARIAISLMLLFCSYGTRSIICPLLPNTQAPVSTLDDVMGNVGVASRTLLD